jgi:RNA polymerase sigma-70 factor (ECF subfamily)
VGHVSHGGPEPKGLLALILYFEAQRLARLDPEGRFVPLSEQDHTLWNHSMVQKAEALLREAERRGRMRQFQFEAAIQSVHVQRAITGQVNG